MSHLSPEKLGALLDGALEATARHDAERHLESCNECRELLAGLRAQDQRLARALEHDPGESYFETFADRVAQRIRSTPRAAAAPAAGRGGWSKWLAPQRLVLVSSTVAVVVVAVLAYVMTQETRVPTMSPTPGERQEAAPVPQAAPEVDHFRDEAAQKKSAEPVPAIERREVGALTGGAEAGAKAGANKPLARAREPQASVKLEGRTNALSETRSDQVAQASRRDAVDRTKLVPVTPRGAREEEVPSAVARDAAPAAPTTPRAVPPATTPPVPESNEKPADGLQSAIRALKERTAAAPLEKRPQSGALQGFAAAPDDAKNLRGEEFAWTPEIRTRVAAAESLAARARASGAAVDHDAAASAWTRVRVLTAPRSAADLEARCLIADERYASWRAEPTRQRHDVAVTALKSALELLPSGARRARYARLLSGM
jgi:hypothetical protein